MIKFKMNLKRERYFSKKGFQLIGLDEAGRGPVAGPVFACALFINLAKISKKEKKLFRKIKDCKKISDLKRERIFKEIENSPSIYFKITKIFPKTIERINILKATQLAMKKSALKLIEELNLKKPFLILDGNFSLSISLPQKSVVKGDEKIVSCALASIIAKVKRDKLMRKYAKLYPDYKFEKNKGYLTKQHLKVLFEIGPSKIHRFSFSPIKDFHN